MLKAGAAKREITPPLGFNMPGYFVKRIAEGVKSPLYTHAVAIEGEGVPFIFISIDIINYDAEVGERIRRRIFEKTGVARENILTCATHIHTGAPTKRPGSDLKGESLKAFSRMVELTVEAACEAWETRRRVRAFCGTSRLENMSFNRNWRLCDGRIVSNPSAHIASLKEELSPIDREVVSVRFEDESGKNVCHIVNFACHADTAGGGRSEYCADYPGEMRRILAEKYSFDSVTVFLCGCSGNVNHIDYALWKKVGGYPYPMGTHYLTVGAALAREVLAADARAVELQGDEVVTRRRVFRASRRQPTREMYEWGLGILSQPDPNPVDKSYAMGWVELYEKPKRFKNIEVQTVRIGDVCVVALPGEVYSDVSLDIKGGSPFSRNIVVALANAGVGYVPTREALRGGVYESKLSRSSSYLSEDTAERMTSTALELIKKL